MVGESGRKLNTVACLKCDFVPDVGVILMFIVRVIGLLLVLMLSTSVAYAQTAPVCPADTLLDLARASYRLRDDDNIYLGRVEAELLRALVEVDGEFSGTLKKGESVTIRFRVTVDYDVTDDDGATSSSTVQIVVSATPPTTTTTTAAPPTTGNGGGGGGGGSRAGAGAGSTGAGGVSGTITWK